MFSAEKVHGSGRTLSPSASVSTLTSRIRDLLSITIVPHTWRNTALSVRKPGDRVNLECDIVAKYVEKLLSRIERPGGLTMDKLKEMGY